MAIRSHGLDDLDWPDQGEILQTNETSTRNPPRLHESSDIKSPKGTRKQYYFQYCINDI